MLSDPTLQVRKTAFTVNGRGFLLRSQDWAYIQYAEDASKGIELFDMSNDPLQYKNLASDPQYAKIVNGFKEQLKAKLAAVRTNDL